MKNYRKNICPALIVLFVLSVHLFAAVPKNVIICIGDGMGFEQVKAARIYNSGEEGSLFFELFPCSGEVATYSANDKITDSAAAATAMATGVKVNNKVISISIPGDQSELKTLLEYLKDQGKSTGLVTSTYISHATPAAFGAHVASRNNKAKIVEWYLNKTRPNILIGGASTITPKAAADAGYTVVTDRKQLLEIDTDATTMLSGQFGKEHMPYETQADIRTNLPHLSEMTKIALDILDNDPDGFFLVLEGGRIDHAGHKNLLKENILETIEFDNSVKTVYNWVKDRKDTLIIVTADHETGGLKVTNSNGINTLPDATWSTKKHTGVNVPLFAWGRKARLFTGEIDNTDFVKLIIDKQINPN